MASTVIEKAAELEEIGAGVQLSPNATRILRELGLMEALASRWDEPSSIRLCSGVTLRRIADVPTGAAAVQRWGAPYCVVHRADLQSVMRDIAVDDPAISLETDRPFDPDLHRTSGRIVIGADGIWSDVRKTVRGAGRSRFSGQVAWRMTLDEHTFSAVADPRRLTAFLGPSTHLVAYPLRKRGTVNLVAIAPGSDRGQRWSSVGDNEDGTREQLVHAFRRFSPELVSLFEKARLAGLWPIHEVEDGRWHDGRTVLIGDAAHGMTPYAAQGAAMAIEDAYGLAGLLADDPAAGERAIGKFVSARKPRIEKVRRRAAFNRFAYHARGPFRLGRDIVLALRSPNALAADFDWLYGDRPRR